MPGPTQQRRLEQALSLVRAGGLIAGAAYLSLRGSSPRPADTFATILLPLLALGTVIIAVLLRRASSARALERLGRLAFVFDATMILGAVSIWGVELPSETSSSTGDLEPLLAVSLLFLLPVEGALRFRLPGGVVAAIVGSLYLAAATTAIASLEDRPWDVGDFMVVTGMLFAIGILIGAMSQGWHERVSSIERHGARLFEMDRLKDRYIAMTSHEIRGPLTAMITAVDTVRTRWDQLEAHRRDHLLEMVYLQGHQLDRLVEDLMISAEVQSGGVAMQPRWEELEPVVKRALDAAAAKRRSHLLEVFVEPLRAEIDPYRFAQIIRNLVENAFKYTPDRTRVAVTLKGVEDGLQLQVADDGEGLPAEKREKLFEAFSRIEETAAGQEGVGLGLYVVSQLIAAMDGRIDLTSSSRGTTFSIFVPCRHAPLEQAHVELVKDPDQSASG